MTAENLRKLTAQPCISWIGIRINRWSRCRSPRSSRFHLIRGVLGTVLVPADYPGEAMISRIPDTRLRDRADAQGVDAVSLSARQVESAIGESIGRTDPDFRRRR
jgi:hypothetical protein